MSSSKAESKDPPPPAPAVPPVILAKSPSETNGFIDLYPQRKSTEKPEFSLKDQVYGHNRENALKNVCNDLVIYAIETLPMIRTMLGGLEAMGCPVEIDRHFSCDLCKAGSDPVMNHGNYDEEANQVFVCANNIGGGGTVHAVLVRNLMSMFDRCMSKVDFKNVDHLACTEVRKANLAGCEYINYLYRVDAEFAWKGKHKDCVRNTAVEYMVKAKFVDEDVAKAAVDRVFNKCYQDLEPIGRRACNEIDLHLAHKERFLCGYK